MNVLVTGANGFVGTALCKKLISNGATVFGTVRSMSKASELADEVRPVPLDLDDVSTLNSFAGRFDKVVHLAARVHQMKETAADPLEAFRAANTRATANLARWSVSHGVRRFIFVSSIKVNGEGQDSSTAAHAYTEQDAAAPQDSYGVSKWEAELVLQQISKETGLESVILRPTLIYGPNVKANFLRLIHLVKMGLPLPLGGVQNARSLVFLGNLVDAICISLTHKRAAGQTFLVSDGVDLSTPELIRGLSQAMARPALLFPFPPRLLSGIGRLTGKSAPVQRLLGTLRVDSRKIRETLGWQPPYNVSQGLEETVKAYLDQLVGEQKVKRSA